MDTKLKADIKELLGELNKDIFYDSSFDEGKESPATKAVNRVLELKDRIKKAIANTSTNSELERQRNFWRSKYREQKKDNTKLLEIAYRDFKELLNIIAWYKRKSNVK